MVRWPVRCCPFSPVNLFSSFLFPFALNKNGLANTLLVFKFIEEEERMTKKRRRKRRDICLHFLPCFWQCPSHIIIPVLLASHLFSLSSLLPPSFPFRITLLHANDCLPKKRSNPSFPPPSIPSSLSS